VLVVKCPADNCFLFFFQAVSSSGTRGFYIIESFKVNDVFFSLISSPLVMDEIKIKRGRRKKKTNEVVMWSLE
jgi:hypothetical protein